MASLPLDILMEIISRLPLKSLLRFRCVCKSFCCLIDSPQFIKFHLNRSVETNSNLSLIILGKSPDEIFSASLDSLDSAVKLDHPFRNSSVEIIGACNGLLAVKNYEKDIALWNPSTKKHQLMPKFWTDFKSHACVGDGFGYDASSDDYKLIRIMTFYQIKYTEVTVYSLRTNSWRRIKNFPYYFPNPCDGVLAAGALHWLVAQTPKVDAHDLILAFDLKSEEFYQMPLPPVENEGYIINVDVLRGCLCVSCLCEHPEPCDIWVMKECSVKESWTKLFSFPQERVVGLSDYVKALAYSNSGHKVLVDNFSFATDEWKLYWYDLENRTTGKSVKIHGVGQGFRDAIICLDSLVSINAYAGEGVSRERRKNC